jgi:hypothetical protein
MSNPPSSGKPDQRHVFGPRTLGAILPPLVKPAFKKRSPATAQLLADWELIVGPAIGQVTTPRKLFQATLAIACSGPIAMELQHLAPTLIARINAHMGQTVVTRLRFVQDHVAKPAPPSPRLPATEAARNAVADLPAGPLRDALESLGRMVLSTSKPPKR